VSCPERSPLSRLPQIFCHRPGNSFSDRVNITEILARSALRNNCFVGSSQGSFGIAFNQLKIEYLKTDESVICIFSSRKAMGPFSGFSYVMVPLTGYKRVKRLTPENYSSGQGLRPELPPHIQNSACHSETHCTESGKYPRPCYEMNHNFVHTSQTGESANWRRANDSPITFKK